MILTREVGTDRYWLIRSSNYVISSSYGTVQECFQALSGKLFDISSEYTVLSDTITNSVIKRVTDYIIGQHPTDLTYEEFCEQFPEFII